MRYHVMTEVPPEEVLERALRFFAEHTRLEAEEDGPDALRFSGEIGTAKIRVDRAMRRPGPGPGRSRCGW